MQLRDLLSKGYFPIQLPIGFGTKRLADSIEQRKAVWDEALAKKSPRVSQAERFSVARSSYSRRTTSILNPVNFLWIGQGYMSALAHDPGAFRQKRDIPQYSRNEGQPQSDRIDEIQRSV
ncbi:hypothetical protein [Pseudomonas sp. NA-150]|uniref:hypothetical protein n=1 Tax=Pseudomonas sp. NA-150 TaxID=3367525 RepID=UPI0037CAD57B